MVANSVRRLEEPIRGAMPGSPAEHPLLRMSFDASELVAELVRVATRVLGARLLRQATVAERFRVWVENLPRPVARSFLFIAEAADASGELSTLETVQQSVPGALDAALEDEGHRRRVAALTQLLAVRAGFTPQAAEVMGRAAQLHDLGKIVMPRSIVLKGEALSADEQVIVHGHPALGALLLRDCQGTSGRLAREIALSHHENWLGSGYPLGLAGEEIPASARLVKLADQYEVLRSERPYKQPCAHREAMTRLLAGDQRSKPEDFDPRLLQILAACDDELARLYNQPELQSAPRRDSPGFAS